MRKERDYYAEIDKALKSHEEFKPCRDKSMEWVADRIDWCWKFRKITREQMEELADRATWVFEREYIMLKRQRCM